MIEFLKKKMGETIEYEVGNEVFRFYITSINYDKQPWRVVAYIDVIDGDEEVCAYFGERIIDKGNTIDKTFVPYIRKLIEESSGDKEFAESISIRLKF